MVPCVTHACNIPLSCSYNYVALESDDKNMQSCLFIHMNADLKTSLVPSQFMLHNNNIIVIISSHLAKINHLGSRILCYLTLMVQLLYIHVLKNVIILLSVIWESIAIIANSIIIMLMAPWLFCMPY